MERNSSENQRIRGEFVGNNVLHCASSLIGDLVENENYTDELMDLCVRYKIDWDAFKREVLEDYTEELEEYLEREYTGKVALEELDEDELRELAEDLRIDPEDYSETVEALEHWIVTDWLGGKLEAKGEIVGQFKDFTIWGRSCSGQAIKMDWVIGEICNDLGMLK